jgi:hypothetical protein
MRLNRPLYRSYTAVSSVSLLAVKRGARAHYRQPSWGPHAPPTWAPRGAGRCSPPNLRPQGMEAPRNRRRRSSTRSTTSSLVAQGGGSRREHEPLRCRGCTAAVGCHRCHLLGQLRCHPLHDCATSRRRCGIGGGLAMSVRGEEASVGKECVMLPQSLLGAAGEDALINAQARRRFMVTKLRYDVLTNLCWSKHYSPSLTHM